MAEYYGSFGIWQWILKFGIKKHLLGSDCGSGVAQQALKTKAYEVSQLFPSGNVTGVCPYVQQDSRLTVATLGHEELGEDGAVPCVFGFSGCDLAVMS